MLRSLIALGATIAPCLASAHALFPAIQTVQTLSERGFARFEAVNGRKDVSSFVVELFDMDWRPTKIAVAMPSQLLIPAQAPDENSAVTRPFSVLIDLDGKSAQQLRVCTKTVFQPDRLRPQVAHVNSRICVVAVLKRFEP